MTVFRAGRIGDYSRSYRRQYLLPDRLVTQVGNPKQVRENRRIIIVVRSADNFFVCRLECKILNIDRFYDKIFRQNFIFWFSADFWHLQISMYLRAILRLSLSRFYHLCNTIWMLDTINDLRDIVSYVSWCFG